MYTAVELKNLQAKPRINDISLRVLADYYAMFLHPFIFRYSIKSNDDGNGKKDIELRFEKENFCHLAGLETVARNAVPYREIHRYKGINGWNGIYGNNTDGFIIDIPHLKSLNKKKFLSMKAKLVYFYLLPELAAVPLAVEFKNEKVNPPTKIDCEIMFYSAVKGDNAIIHLGIKKDEKLRYYIPKTFFIEKVSDKCDDIYLARQEEIQTTVLDRIIML